MVQVCEQFITLLASAQKSLKASAQDGIELQLEKFDQFLPVLQPWTIILLVYLGSN